jgi:hypothetical protein
MEEELGVLYVEGLVPYALVGGPFRAENGGPVAR